MKKLSIFCVLICLLILAACATPSEAPTPTIEPTATPVPTPSPDEFIEEGEEFLDQDQLEEAEQAFLKALEVDSEVARAHANLALTYLRQDTRFEDMLAEAEKAVELDPEDSYNLAVLAQVQVYQLRSDEALENAEKAYQKNPEDLYVARTMANVYLWRYQYEQAWEVLEKLMADFPDDPQTYEILGNYFSSISETGLAYAAFSRAAELAPELSRFQLHLADLASSRDDYESAETIYQSILENEPENRNALMGLIYSHIYRYQYDLAEEMIDKLSESFPEEYIIYIAKGDLLYFQDDNSGARSEYQKALELNPYSSYSQLRIGYSYMSEDECERARIHFQDLIDEYPLVLSYQIGESWADLCTGKIDQAVNKLQDVIETDPYNANAHSVLGYAYVVQERWEDAKDSYADALNTSLQLASVHADIGNMLIQQGFEAEAELELARAIELNPYNLQPYNALTGLFLDQGRYQEASETIQKAAEINPEESSTLYQQGYVQYLEGESEKTIETMNKVLEKDPESYYAHLFIGLAKRNLGQYDEAKRDIETYMALMGDYLPEEETNLITFLLDSLENGYTITESEALDSINDFLGYFDMTGTNPRFETIEDRGKTLVFDLRITAAEQDAGEYMMEVGLIMAINAVYVPRISPELDGGCLINVKVSGRDAFTMSSNLTQIKNYADTLISVDEYISGLAYDSPSGTAPRPNFSRIINDVSSVREIPVQHIPAQEAITEDSFREETAESVDEQTQETFDQEGAMLALLELIPEDYDYGEGVVDMNSESIAGFYVPSEDIIYLVERAELSFEDQLTLAHESAHALQYQHFEIDIFDDESLDDDEELAYLSLIEGDASLSAFMYMNEHISVSEQMQLFSSGSELDADGGEDYPSFMIDFLSFPYDHGFDFVNALYEKGGWEEIDQAYENPPVSSEQILHPDLYFDGEMPLQIDLTSLVEEIGDGWEEEDKNVMGEFGIFLMMAEYFGPYAAHETAEGWGGDQYVFLENAESSSNAFLMRIDWDDPDEAQEFWNNFKIAMRHRNQYQEVVTEFVLETDTRTWTNGSTYVVIHLNGASTYLVFGSEQSEAEHILDTVMQ